MKKKMKYLASLFLCFAVILTLMPMRSEAADNASNSAPSTIRVSTEGTYYENEAREVLRLVNEERAKVGAEPLKMTVAQENLAKQRAAELVAYNEHVRPDGSSCFTAAGDFGIGWTAIGENIASGQRNAAAVMKAWMNSTGHRENILSTDFSDIGIACFEYNGIKYWVQFFTRPYEDLQEAPATGSDQVDATVSYDFDTTFVNGSALRFTEDEANAETGQSIELNIEVYAPVWYGGTQKIGTVDASQLPADAVHISGNDGVSFENGQIIVAAQAASGDAVVEVTVANTQTIRKTIHVKGSAPAETETTAPVETETETTAPVETETETTAPVETETETTTPAETETETTAPVETETETTAPIETETETTAPVETETETIAPVETETETTAPVESETDTETTAPVETETETTAPVETETETTAPVETETETTTPVETETETETTPVETETETMAPVESETDTETTAPVESETETETTAPVESETETETTAPVETETETIAPVETETETTAPVETETETETTAPIETETETKTPESETETTQAAVDPEGTQPTSGSGQAQSTETNSQKDGTDSVQTGDNFPMLICVSVMIGSAVIIVGILFVLKRKGYKKF